ncbi:MAG: U32 family peptidase [Bacilli bacterium]|nr:U32 family peptidase [Bacilli bacterium]
MKRIELLAPAGNMDNLVAAVEAGCDAVYLGGKSFGARAFSKNFSDEEIIKAINYCHLYGVKVYVTVNTIIYENEVDSFVEYIDFLHKNNVDAVLIQDLGMLDLIRKTYPNLEIHSSTQMHIHNLDGVQFMEKLGVRRVVLARETSIDEIKKIKSNSNVELEVFVHGALCISYSGECLMSSLIGGRSGNRGECAGSCRLRYDVVDSNNKRLNRGDYPLSTKDLNTLEYVGDLIDSGVSSLKIEGRMKSKEYVYMVVSLYRHAIDSYYERGKVEVNKSDLIKLKKIFNRKYTKGFIMNTKNNDLINDYRPNHQGVEIGEVISYSNNIAKIKLFDTLTIGSGLRVVGNPDVGISVNDFYIKNKLVKEAHKGEIISIKVKDIVKVGSPVLITLDSGLNKEIDSIIDSNLRKVSIVATLSGIIGNKLKLEASDGNNNVILYGNIVEKSKNNPTTKEEIKEKLYKLGGSVYKYSKLTISIDDDIFIPLKEINELRRKMIEELNNRRLYKIEYIKNEYSINVPNFNRERLLTCLVNDKTYANLNKKYDFVYSESKIENTILKIPRVVNEYKYTNDMLLVGEIGAFNKLKNICTDFSFNVVNSYTVAFLHSIGAYRITLSYELNDNQIMELIDSYVKRYNSHPNLELIVYGYPEVMISKFNMEEYYNSKNISLIDRFNNKFKIRVKDNYTYIYYYNCIDKYNEKYYEMGINSLRYNFDC